MLLHLLQWSDFMALSHDVPEAVLEERIRMQAPNKCCLLIYTVRKLTSYSSFRFKKIVYYSIFKFKIFFFSSYFMIKRMFLKATIFISYCCSCGVLIHLLFFHLNQLDVLKKYISTRMALAEVKVICFTFTNIKL